MSANQKNFVVSFRSDDSNINTIMEGGFGRDIMSIIIAINSCSNFEEARTQKIALIQEHISKNMKNIDFLIYLYGHSRVMADYINRFGPIVYSQFLDADFATIIIDNIIVIYEAYKFPDVSVSHHSSPVASPVASHVASHIASPVASQVASPVASRETSHANINPYDEYDNYSDEEL
jgi:hypothetical protein